MTSEQTTTTPLLLFKNEAGDYFVLPQETLERSRVTEEAKAEVERLVAEAGEVSGYDLAGNVAERGVQHLATGYLLIGVAQSFSTDPEMIVKGSENLVKAINLAKVIQH